MHDKYGIDSIEIEEGMQELAEEGKIEKITKFVIIFKGFEDYYVEEL